MKLGGASEVGARGWALPPASPTQDLRCGVPSTACSLGRVSPTPQNWVVETTTLRIRTQKRTFLGAWGPNPVDLGVFPAPGVPPSHPVGLGAPEGRVLGCAGPAGEGESLASDNPCPAPSAGWSLFFVCLF